MSGATTVKGGRILVVDDEPMLRDTLAQVLSEEGYIVDSATDGVEALDRVRAARPDVILLDLMMPGMNGRQFLQTIRDDPEHQAIPVLIMTAVHGLDVNLGGSEVVEKPFQVEDLLNKVALAVYRSRDADRAVSLPPAPAEPPPEAIDRGVVLLVEHDRARLQQLDLQLSGRGYTVVSMTRALGQLSRLARALRPRAILLEMASEGVGDVVRELRTGEDIPILVFTRGGAPSHAVPDVLEHAADADLVSFVERQP